MSWSGVLVRKQHHDDISYCVEEALWLLTFFQETSAEPDNKPAATPKKEGEEEEEEEGGVDIDIDDI